MFLLILGMSIKESSLISLFAVLPDLDVFFNSHRSISHSVFFIMLVFGLISLVLYYKYKKYVKYAVIGCIVTLTHPILDVFQTYTPILWPVYPKAIMVITDLKVNMSELSNFNFVLDFVFDIKCAEEAFGVPSSEYPGMMFSGLGISVLLVLFGALILKKVGINDKY